MTFTVAKQGAYEDLSVFAEIKQMTDRLFEAEKECPQGAFNVLEFRRGISGKVCWWGNLPP